jgi:hypothetical protein
LQKRTNEQNPFCGPIKRGEKSQFFTIGSQKRENGLTNKDICGIIGMYADILRLVKGPMPAMERAVPRTRRSLRYFRRLRANHTDITDERLG